MKNIKTIYNYILKHPLTSLLIYGFLLRLVLIICYQHISIFPDSEDYTNLAEYISQWDLTNYTGQRTPGFPALIAISGQHLTITVFIQLILGLINCYFIFEFSRFRTKNIVLSFWISMITTSFLHVVFYEFAILTETLSFTLVLLSFWYIEKFQVLKDGARFRHIFILSLIFGFLYLTRPMFIYFPIGFSLFYLVKNLNANLQKTIVKSTAILIIPFICFYSWNKLNENNIGYFTSSYYLGINLAQTATSFFEKAPNEDKLIRDIVVKHRTYVEQNEPKTKYPMTIWYAYDELIEKTELSPPELSDELGRISINLFKEHPELYAKQVFMSWRNFWGSASSLLWNADDFNFEIIKKVLVGTWNYLQKWLLILFNFLFLVFSLRKLFHFIKGRLKEYDMDLFLIAIVISGSLAQALVAYGTNSRFCFPFFALIVYFVLSNVFTLKNLYLNHADNPSS